MVPLPFKVFVSAWAVTIIVWGIFQLFESNPILVDPLKIKFVSPEIETFTSANPDGLADKRILNEPVASSSKFKENTDGTIPCITALRKFET